MGTTKFTYIGPYLKVKNESRTELKSGLGCATPACPNYQKELTHTHCAKCGAVTSHMNVKVKIKALDMRNICEEELQEKFCSAWTSNEINFQGYAYLMPSSSKNHPREFLVKDNYDFSVNNNLNSLEEVNWLKQNFQKELSLLQEQFPNNPFTVEWGLVTYAY